LKPRVISDLSHDCLLHQSPKANPWRSSWVDIRMSPSRGKHTPPALPLRPSSLLFINTTEEQSNGRATEEARKLVRSHVMSAFYRQKSLSKEEQADLAERGKEATRGGTVGKFRLEGRTRTRSTKRVKTGSSWIEQKPQMSRAEPLRLSMNIPLGIATDIQMDPFGVAALPLDSRMQKYILHCAFSKPIHSSIGLTQNNFRWICVAEHPSSYKLLHIPFSKDYSISSYYG
jgi:hypothetical protein